MVSLANEEWHQCCTCKEMWTDEDIFWYEKAENVVRMGREMVDGMNYPKLPGLVHDDP